MDRSGRFHCASIVPERKPDEMPLQVHLWSVWPRSLNLARPTTATRPTSA